jgi:hypothetical protein
MIMIPEVQVFAQVAAISAGLIAACCGIAVATYRSVKHTDSKHLPANTEVSQRLDQLQQSVDAIAIEVERLAEAQRFTARLEAERESRHALPSQS